jgi:hypothetical protein
MLFSPVVTVASFAILIPLRWKCSKSYSAYFGKNAMCCTQEKYFPNAQRNCYFGTDTTFRVAGGIGMGF